MTASILRYAASRILPNQLDWSWEKWVTYKGWRKRSSHIQQNQGRLTLLVTFCLGTAFWRTLMKEKKSTGRRGWRRKQLLDDLKKDKILEIERGSTRSHCVENSLWKRLWTHYAMKALYKFTCSNAGHKQNSETLRKLIPGPRLKPGIWGKQRRLLPSGPHSSVRPHSAALLCKIDNSVGSSYFLQIPIRNERNQ